MKCPDQIHLLITTDWYLPGYKAGGPIQSVANLVGILKDVFQVGVLCSDRDYLSDSAYDNIPVNEWSNQNGVWVMYLSPDRLNYSVIAGVIQINAPKVLYINGMFSKSFSLYPLLASRRSNFRRVVAPRGMLAPGALGIKPLKKKSFLKLTKGLGLYKGVEWHATHEHEAEHIQNNIRKNARIAVLANLPGAPVSKLELIPKVAGQITILCVARIASEKNIDFALRCLAKVSKDFKVTFIHVGATYSETYFEQCKSIEMPSHVQLAWLGALPPSDIEKLYPASHLFFLPSLGENYGHAIVESLLRGIPVLISDQTPWRNLGAEGFGADLPLGSTAAFTNYICTIASMDSDAYGEKYHQIAQRIAAKMDLPELTQSYKAFFE